MFEIGDERDTGKITIATVCCADVLGQSAKQRSGPIPIPAELD
jgi:hypothetical protein